MNNSNDQNTEPNHSSKKNNIVLNAFRNAAAPLVVTFGTGKPLYNDNGITRYGLFSSIGTSVLVAYGIYHDIKENIEIDSFVKRLERERSTKTEVNRLMD